MLLGLRTVQSLFLRRDFSVQRPRTLLSPEHVNALADLIRDACAIGLNTPRYGLRLDAAGAGSPTMRRLGQTLAEKASMPFAPAHISVCIMPSRAGSPMRWMSASCCTWYMVSFGLIIYQVQLPGCQQQHQVQQLLLCCAVLLAGWQGTPIGGGWPQSGWKNL